MNLFVLIVIYVIGYILTLIGLIKFGKRLGYDYDNQPKTWANEDEFDSNASAYLCLSIIWPFFILINLVCFGVKALVAYVQKFIK